MNMESNYSGAEEAWDRKFRDANGKVLWDKLRQSIVDSQAQPLNREEFERKIAVIMERNRKRAEEKKRNELGDQHTPDTAA